MKLKKYVAVVLSLTLFLSNLFTVNADGIIGELITDSLGMNNLTVSAALNTYFNSREAFLLSQANVIDASLTGIEDEVTHKEDYESKSIVFVDSVISIDNIIAGDIYADADVTETVTYMKDGITNTAIVTHKLLLGLNGNNAPAVVYDAYYEAFSGFRSCSYVDETNTASTNTIIGSGSCIVHVAEGELNYTEGTDGYTKYGDWYTDSYGNGVDFSRSAWCVMFVSWCAAQAQIPASIIAPNANQTQMLNFFYGLGKYYSRTTAINDLAPESGDMVFFSDNRVDASHIGIVRYVDANYIYVVHGNNSQGKVAFMTVSRTNDWILGYAKPAYSSGHTMSRFYSYDSFYHWKECTVCGYVSTKESHTFVENVIGQSYMCSDCGYVTNNPILRLLSTPAFLCGNVLIEEEST